MISKYKAYWMILKETHTPLIFMLDEKYLPMLKTSITKHIEQLQHLKYIYNLMDCDNFVFILKGYADTKGNGMGIVYGKYKSTTHMWNIALLGYDTIQIEPQQGIIRTIDKHLYRPLVVVL